MKKRLLLSLMAVAFAVGSFAQTYFYTSTGKFKTTGANLWSNGTFTEGTTGWSNESNGDLASNWELATSVGPNSENALKSATLSPDDGSMAVHATVLTTGIYVVSYKAKAATAFTTNITAGSNNFVCFFTNTTGDNTMTRTISESVTIGEEWTQIVDTVNVTTESDEYLMFNLKNIPSEAMFTDFQVYKVTKVFDDRPLKRKIAYAKVLMEDDNFKEAGEDDGSLDELAGTIEDLEGKIETGALDYDQGAAEDDLNDALADYLDASSWNQADQLANIDITSISNAGRGSLTTAGSITLEGGNWGKLAAEPDALRSAIQNSYSNTAKFTVQNAYFPAGKYYFTAEIRNANTTNQSWPCTPVWDLSTTCKIFIADKEKEIGPVQGEEYQRFYFVADVDNNGEFKAGISWPGPSGAFFIRNVEVRSFANIAGDITRKQTWEEFKKQYDAAVNARKALIEAQANAELPWAQDSLAKALTKWDPYYNDIMAKGWVDADGNDTKVASVEDLADWAKYQGVEMYTTQKNEETGEDEQVRLEYQLVRGYQYAVTYVKNQNEAVTNLKAAITAAEAERDDPMNSNGDKVTFQAAIDAAQAVFNDVIATTTDAKKEADVTRLGEAGTTLAAAVTAFKKSAELSPIVDINFSNGFEAVEAEGVVTGYVINGTKGKMEFTAAGMCKDGDGNLVNDGFVGWALGFGSGDALVLKDVLRVGKTAAIVNIDQAEQPTENDVIRVQFDFWGGYLVSRNLLIVDLQNAAGERIAGFNAAFPRNGGMYMNYNDFNNEANTGMDFLSKITTMGSKTVANADFCVDNNKTSFDLIIDYKAKAIQGTIKNGKNGESAGVQISFDDIPSSTLTDKVFAKFSVSAGNHDNYGRRSWFDNLVIWKYASTAEGPIPAGINEVAAPAAVKDNAIYTISGVRVAKPTQKGLYIINGKKVVIK